MIEIIEKELNSAISFICKEIPEGWEIRIVVRNDEAEMELVNPEGEEVSTDWDGDCHELSWLLTCAKQYD